MRNFWLSRGAYSVGAHLVTNGGDNEGLFRAGMRLDTLGQEYYHI